MEALEAAQREAKECQISENHTGPKENDIQAPNKKIRDMYSIYIYIYKYIYIYIYIQEAAGSFRFGLGHLSSSSDRFRFRPVWFK